MAGTRPSALKVTLARSASLAAIGVETGTGPAYK
jgi:hypothetical protein